MGMYHGTKYIGVLIPQASACYVLASDLKPTGEFGSFVHEPTYLPTPDDLRGQPVFDSESEAQIAVKKHIFSITQQQVMERVVCAEQYKMDIQEIRGLQKNSLDRTIRINDIKEMLRDMEKEIKDLHAVRRRRVKVSYTPITEPF